MARAHTHSVVLVGWAEEIGRALEPLLRAKAVTVSTVQSIGGAIAVLDHHRNCLVVADVDAGIDPMELRRRMVAGGHGGIPTVLVARRTDAARLRHDEDVVAVITSLNAELLLELAWTHCRVAPNGEASPNPGGGHGREPR